MYLNDKTAYWTPFTTPLGTAYIASTRRGVCRLSIPNETEAHFKVGLQKHFAPDYIRPHPEPNIEAVQELDAYWHGERTRFELRLDLQGTPFQKKTWDSLLRIPFGQTTTYRELANQINNPHGYQAVGAAVGQNPVLLIVPCHRVLGADGSLTGYAAGPNTKKWLLRHEGVLLL